MRGLLAAILCLALSATAAAQVSSAVRQETQIVRGLAQPARILIDQWGVAHIYAQSERDAFFLQGYNAARDRLWQIDLWRKRGLGLLSESFGSDYLAQDRAARLFLYRGDMNAEWAGYGRDARARTEAFVAGINAYVDGVRAGALPLPIEFTLTDTQPAHWRAQDVVRIRSHALSRNVDSEVTRARVVCAAGLEADTLRRPLEPAWTTQVPEGLDPCSIPADVLADYQRATREVVFAAPPSESAGETLTFGSLAARTEQEGSNNWVVSPQRTETGRPILANDPHRALGVPSLRYIVHLDAPGMSVIGAGEPALPGVSIGHNGAIAFGLTIFAIDQEDLYVYELNPRNPRQYRYRGRWETMREVRETIPVRGERSERASLFFTRHGPVVKIDYGNHRAFAIRSVWSESGTSAYLGSSAYMSARSWEEFLHATEIWGAPSENLVFASTAGDIGWTAVGRAPRRRNWDGLLPVPGDGRYEWDGFIPAAELPRLHNPSAGWFASANEMNLPPDYPIHERRLGFEWSNPTRIAQISRVLAADSRVSLADSMALQTDATNFEACRLTALLRPLKSDEPALREGLRLLSNWDCRESVESSAAALYEIWVTRHLGPATLAAATPPAVQALAAPGSTQAIIPFLSAPDARLGADPMAARDALLLSSLASAIQETRGLLGADMRAWRWGALHRAHFRPSVARLAPPALSAQMSVGPLQLRGSGSTPAAASYRSRDFAVVAGASFRMVLDVGAWDNSVAVNTPGQSGDPYSAHYRDLFPLWAAGEYFPLLYSREAVERAARAMIVLNPR